MRYSYGGVAEYLTEGFVELQDGQIVSETITRSSTNLLNLLVRVAFEF